jgi:hypothetical protein
MSDDELTETYGKAWAEARKLNEARRPADKLGERTFHIEGLRAVADSVWAEGKRATKPIGGSAGSPYKQRFNVRQMWPNE